MNSIISKTFALVVVSAALLSFSPNFGGEGFGILLNGKLLLQKYGSGMSHVKTLDLSKSLPNDKITIRYFHCGKVAKNRLLTIKDVNDKVIKIWRFKDAVVPEGDMSCNVPHIAELKKEGNSVFKIFYTSSELPEGRMLATMIFDNKVVAARN